MQAVTVPAKVKRGPVLYARLKEENHAWLHQQAHEAGYDSVSEYTDTLIETLRAGASVKAKLVKKSASAKKAKRASRKAK